MDPANDQERIRQYVAEIGSVTDALCGAGQAISKASKPTPVSLYHYTDAHGLMGIHEKQCLWSTNARFLNDEMELSWSSEVFGKALDEYPCENAEEREMLDRMKEATTLLNSGLQIFCFSFSEKRDDLNQWRGYAGTASPYCIGFEAEQLSWQMASSELLSVIYDREEQDAIAKSIIDLVVCFYRENLYRQDDVPAYYHMGHCIHQFRIITSYASLRFKSPHWQGEREWRLVTVFGYRDQLEDRIKFRAGRFGVIPYIELFTENTAGIKRLAIDSITVGPTPLREATLQATQMYLGRSGYFLKEGITASTVPIR